MRFALCMVVRDEASRLVDCLDPIFELIDQFVIVDTGSMDGTPALLRNRYGLDVLRAETDESRCGCLCDSRSLALSNVDTPWVLTLDADERIEPSVLEAIRAMPDLPEIAGYFGRWRNHLQGEEVFDDYKLFLFRNFLRPIGLVHDVVQLDIRQRELHAEWMDGLLVRHLPNAARAQTKMNRYRERLLCAIRQQPDFYRYHWFLGYMAFRLGNNDDSINWLSEVTNARSPMFPVETLNSAMVMADIHARTHQIDKLQQILASAREMYECHREEFEVRVNFELGPWLAAAKEYLQAGDFDQIRAYRFAC